MSVHNTINVSKVIYKCREPILLLPISDLSSILTLSLVEQELLTFPEHPHSPPGFSWVCVTRSLVLYVCFVDSFLFFDDTVKSLLFVGYQYSWVGRSTKLRIQQTMKLGKQFDIDIQPCCPRVTSTFWTSCIGNS